MRYGISQGVRNLNPKGYTKVGKLKGRKTIILNNLPRIRMFPLSNFPLQSHLIINTKMVVDSFEFCTWDVSNEKAMYRIEALLCAS